MRTNIIIHMRKLHILRQFDIYIQSVGENALNTTIMRDWISPSWFEQIDHWSSTIYGTINMIHRRTLNLKSKQHEHRIIALSHMITNFCRRELWEARLSNTKSDV